MNVPHDSIWSDTVLDFAELPHNSDRSTLAPFLIWAARFRFCRKSAMRLAETLEKGPVFSITLRDILLKHFDVGIGAYSYGPILRPGALPRGTRIGNYCSVGSGLIVRRRNHPIDRLTQHPFFYNHRLGLLRRDSIETNEDNPLKIGHDVWIGDRVTILSKCRLIGNGAVIAAGSVVTKDVPPYAIVSGVPAQVQKMRYTPSIITILEKSQWWSLALSELCECREWLLDPATQKSVKAFAAKVEVVRRRGS